MRKESLDCEFEASGTLYVFRDAAEFERSQWLPRALRRNRHADRDARRASRTRWSPRSSPASSARYFNPGDAHLRPDRYVGRARGSRAQRKAA